MDLEDILGDMPMVLICMWTTPSGDSLFNDHPMAHSMPGAGVVHPINVGLWRVQAAFDLPTERFSAFDLTDETVGEQFDQAAVVAGEIRIGDGNYLQPDRIANVQAAGGDIIVRARWNGVRWLYAVGERADLIAILKAARGRGLVDQPI